MPLYQYKCSCGETFEKLVKIADRDSVSCPSCKDGFVTRPISAGQFIPFKEGWYEHIDPAGPIYIKNMGQLKEECSKRGLTSVYAEDSLVHK